MPKFSLSLSRFFSRFSGKRISHLQDLQRLQGVIESLQERIIELQAENREKKKSLEELQALQLASANREKEALQLALKSSQCVADWLALRSTGRPIYGVAPPLPPPPAPQELPKSRQRPRNMASAASAEAVRGWAEFMSKAGISDLSPNEGLDAEAEAAAIARQET